MKIGIDLGGSHIGIGIVNDNGIVISKRECEILQIDMETVEKFIIENICKLIYKVLEEQRIGLYEIKSIGIAAPGIVRNGVIVKSKNLNLNNFPIIEELKKYFPIPMTLKNDGKCAAIAEKEYGSLKPYSDGVFINIGTGIGGAVFVNGKLLESPRGAGYELGHTVIQMNGKKCSCGKAGCFEAYASVVALRKLIEEKLEFDEPITGKKLLEVLKSQEFEEQYIPILNEYIDYLSVGISNIINIFEPEIVVIGGSLAYYEEIILEMLKENIRRKKYLYNDETFPKIVMAKLKNDAGIIGATIEKK